MIISHSHRYIFIKSEKTAGTSIEAALYPASVPYLYFVADSDGHHEFRTTFKEHREAKERIRRDRGK